MTTCAECKFWEDTDTGVGACSLAEGTSEITNPPMHAVYALYTEPTFGCNAGEKK